MAAANAEKSEGFSIMKLALLPIRVVSHSLEVFMRKHIGERYFEPIDWIMTTIFLSMLIAFTRSSVAMFDTWLFSGFLTAFMSLGIIHIIRSRRRHRANKEIHSYYSGKPLIIEFLPIPESIARMYAEPFLLILIGGLMLAGGKYMYYPLYGMGFYIAVGGVLMLIKAQIEYSFQRRQYLDALDKKIESEVLTETLHSRKNASDTKGFSVPGPKMASQESRRGIEQMYRSLDGNLQQLIAGKDSQPSMDSRSERPQEPARQPEPPKDMER